MRSAKRQASGSKLKNKKKDFFLKLRVPVELFLIFFFKFSDVCMSDCNHKSHDVSKFQEPGIHLILNYLNFNARTKNVKREPVTNFVFTTD